MLTLISIKLVMDLVDSMSFFFKNNIYEYNVYEYIYVYLSICAYIILYTCIYI